jgi:hypothetical protein
MGTLDLPHTHPRLSACTSLMDGHVRYVPGPGLPELRDVIAEEATRRGRPTMREEVPVTMGAKHALTQSLLTMIDAGDEVIFPNPGYPPDEFCVVREAPEPGSEVLGRVIREAPVTGSRAVGRVIHEPAPRGGRRRRGRTSPAQRRLGKPATRMSGCADPWGAGPRDDRGTSWFVTGGLS